MPFCRGHDRIVGTDETVGAQPGTTQMNVETRDGQRLYADRWLAIFVLCSLVFVALTIVVSSFGVAAAERALYQWIVERDTPSLDVLFNLIDALGNEVVLLVAALLLALALPSRRGQPWWLLIVVLLLSSGIEELVEQIVGRSGPGGAGAGFPSGGAAATAGFFVIGAYLLQQAVATEIGKAAVWGGAVTCVVLVSIGRIIVHTQWPLDTLGGVVLGLASAAGLVCMVKADQTGLLRQVVGALGPWLPRAARDKETPAARRSSDSAEPSPFLQVLYYLYQRRLLAQVSGGAMPQHIGIILDGNRRYGAQRGLTEPREIYLLGALKLDDILGWCSELRIPAVTLWVLSTDNLTRPPAQLSGIIAAVESKLNALAADARIHRRRVRVRAVGRIDLLPESTQRAIESADLATAGYDGMILTIAVAYGGREEIADAVRAMLRERSNAGAMLADVVEEVTPKRIGKYLYTVDLPDPDLIIRTSGEIRLSGFLLWQSAHSEFYFSDVFWPAFRKIDLLRAIRDFQRRKRRFGQ
jgi:short-chain Z-isoprenyl diphosphate synthase